jgi:hypothetical protein
MDSHILPLSPMSGPVLLVFNGDTSGSHGGDAEVLVDLENDNLSTTVNLSNATSEDDTEPTNVAPNYDSDSYTTDEGEHEEWHETPQQVVFVAGNGPTPVIIEYLDYYTLKTQSLFTDHPTQQGQTYLEHLVDASSQGLLAMYAGGVLLIHSIFPCIAQEVGSYTITQIHRHFADKRKKSE